MRPPLRGIRYRRARQDDMHACGRVFARAVPTLSMGLGPPFHPRPSDMVAILSHVRETDPGGFQVAEVGGKVVGYASVIARGPTDFLTQFWVNPSLKGRGAGRPLLARAFRGVSPGPRDVRCVYASVDPRAQHLYLSFGMLPRTMVYNLAGPPGRLPRRPSQVVDLEPACEPGDPRREALDLAARHDRGLRGARRDADIAFLVRARKATVFRARERGREVGYVVAGPTGQVGPGGTASPASCAGLLWSALREVRRLEAEEASTFVPGTNGAALDVALRAGMRNRFPGVWMAAREVMANERYLGGSGILW